MDDKSESGLKSFFDKIDAAAVRPEIQSYACSDVPVTYALELPIVVAAKGSAIKYSFSCRNGDVSFGIFLRPDTTKEAAAANVVNPPEVSKGNKAM